MVLTLRNARFGSRRRNAEKSAGVVPAPHLAISIWNDRLGEQLERRTNCSSVGRERKDVRLKPKSLGALSMFSVCSLLSVRKINLLAVSWNDIGWCAMGGAMEVARRDVSQ